jgi:hypothetical protein
LFENTPQQDSRHVERRENVTPKKEALPMPPVPKELLEKGPSPKDAISFDKALMDKLLQPSRRDSKKPNLIFDPSPAKPTQHPNNHSPNGAASNGHRNIFSRQVDYKPEQKKPLLPLVQQSADRSRLQTAEQDRSRLKSPKPSAKSDALDAFAEAKSKEIKSLIPHKTHFKPILHTEHHGKVSTSEKDVYQPIQPTKTHDIPTKYPKSTKEIPSKSPLKAEPKKLQREKSTKRISTAVPSNAHFLNPHAPPVFRIQSSHPKPSIPARPSQPVPPNPPVKPPVNHAPKQRINIVLPNGREEKTRQREKDRQMVLDLPDDPSSEEEPQQQEEIPLPKPPIPEPQKPKSVFAQISMPPPPLPDPPKEIREERIEKIERKNRKSVERPAIMNFDLAREVKKEVHMQSERQSPTKEKPKNGACSVEFTPSEATSQRASMDLMMSGRKISSPLAVGGSNALLDDPTSDAFTDSEAFA